jgi:hypothetical protein
MDVQDLHPKLHSTLVNEIEPGETLVWLDQPNPKAYAWMSLPIILFAIPWTAFAIFWIAGASEFKIPKFHKPWDLFPLFGLPFFLIGLGMLSSPFWAMRTARGTVYAITDRRVLIIQKLFSARIRTVLPHQIGNLSRKQKDDGSGTIQFENLSDTEKRLQNETQKMPLGFYGVSDVKNVERLLRELAESTK